MLRSFSRVEVTERITSEEFFHYAPDDKKAELVDGVMIVSPPPLDIHEKLRIFLLRLLGDYIEQFDLGELRGSRTAVVLADDQTYEPDILFVAKNRADIIEERGIVGAPDLVIEILLASTAMHDRGAKFRTYERSGMRELWLIDPYGPAGTEFYQREADRFNPIMPDENDLVQSITLPGFKLNTTWLWPADKFISVRAALNTMIN